MKNKVRVPMTPKYIVCNGVARHISEYDDEELEAIGAAWILNLIKKARQKNGETLAPLKEIIL